MRRATLITLIVLVVLILVATVEQARLGHGPRHYPGPTGSFSPPPASSATP